MEQKRKKKKRKIPTDTVPQHVPTLWCFRRRATAVVPEERTYFLAVLENPFLRPDAGLGAGGVRFPLSVLNVHVHVELPTEHGDLRLCQQPSVSIGRHLEGQKKIYMYI